MRGDRALCRPCARASARSSGMAAAQASNSSRSGASVASSANATSSASRSIAHSSGRVSPMRLDRAGVLLGERDVGDGRVVGREGHRHARAVQARERVGGHATARSRPGRSTSGRGRGSRRGRSSSAHERRVVDGAGAVGDPLRVHRERAADLRRAAPLAGVERDPQAAGARGLERRGVGQGIREGLLRAGEVPAGQPLVAEAGRGLGEADVRGGVVRAERRADEPDDRPGPCAAPLRRRGTTAAIPSASGSRPRRGAAAPSGSRRSGRLGRLRLDQLAR